MRTILVVEDSSLLRNAMASALVGGRFNVLQANLGKKALQLLEDSPQRVDLLVTNVHLWDMMGAELAKLARRERDGIKVLMTGSRPSAEADDFLEWPFVFAELIRRADVLLERRGADRRGPPIQGADLIVERRGQPRRAPRILEPGEPTAGRAPQPDSPPLRAQGSL
jgi:DNA-binding response OmpR family regulator